MKCLYCKYQIHKGHDYVCLKTNKKLKQNEKGDFYLLCKKEDMN